ncbi:MAG: rhodanese-like domain-containing protein [Gammaproteobacteria bacterium]|nr:rhodanese-like domain-containing protein [Gammaproteobacteria bacterium]
MRVVRSCMIALVFATWAWVAHAGVPPLVDVLWIRDNSCKPGVVVLDIRNAITGDSEETYRRGHIPCAVYSDYIKDEWRVEIKGVPGQIPSVERMEKLIGNLGIDNDSYVVIYHAGLSAVDTASAARVYWTFKVLGHDNVSILDGGYAGYAAIESFPKEMGIKAITPKQFTTKLRTSMLPKKQEVVKLLQQGAVAVDNRPSADYLGVNQGEAKRKGTILGAKNLPESWITVDNGGEFRSKQNLEKLYQVAGIPLKGRIINFCYAGHWSSLGWFVTSEILGNKEAVNYGGSFVEWSRDNSLPVERHIKIDDF